MPDAWPPWAKLIAGLGFPVFVALYFMMYHADQGSKLEAAQARHNAEAASHVYETHVQTLLLRQICRNSAKSDAQSQFCEYGLPEWQQRP